MSGSKSFTSFTNRFFHFSRPPGLRLAFEAAERNGKFGRIQCQRSEESSSKEKRNRRVFLCRRTMEVEAICNVVLMSFRKLKGTFVRVKDQREGQLVELVCDQSPSTNQQPSQGGDAIPDPVWVESKSMLAFRGSQLLRELPQALSSI